MCITCPTCAKEEYVKYNTTKQLRIDTIAEIHIESNTYRICMCIYIYIHVIIHIIDGTHHMYIYTLCMQTTKSYAMLFKIQYM